MSDFISNGLNVEKIYVHYDLTRNQIREFCIANSDYLSYINGDLAANSNDIGLVYYDNKIDKILMWNGFKWKILPFFDEPDLRDNKQILVENIWVKSNEIPSTLELALSSQIVTNYTQIPLQYITGSSFQFNSGLLSNAIPSSYGSFYAPILYTNDGLTISTSITDWRLEGDVVTLYDGFSYTGSYQYSDTFTPTLTYWKYVGPKGSFGGFGDDSGNFIYTDTYILTFLGASQAFVMGSTISYVQLPTASTINDIRYVDINGLLIYDWSVDSSTNELIFNENALGYTVSNSDYIHIELRSPTASTLAFVELTGTSSEWNFFSNRNATANLTSDMSLDIIGMKDGDSGKLIIQQDLIGGHYLSFPTGSKFEGGTYSLTGTASSEDIAEFVYDGIYFYWKFTKNYY